MILEERIKEFGKEIFSLMGEAQPGSFNKKAISGKIMNWSMSKPDFKVNMFRLVDVLPALHSSRAIATHVSEYLTEPAKDLHGLLEWGVNVPPNSLRAKATAFAVRKSVEEMARLFIAGESPTAALSELKRIRNNGLCFTVDLLGEYSVSESEAVSYLNRYLEALEVFGQNVPKWKSSSPIRSNHPGDKSPINVSVKLSALYSQCSMLNFERSVSVLTDRLSQIARMAKKVDGRLYVDAEDTATNPIILETFKRVFASEEFKDFPCPGIVVQAYCRDSLRTCEEILDYAKQRGGKIAVRLVKGAYWDQEVVSAAQHGWEIPVFQIKKHSDAQFELLSRYLVDNHSYLLPAFGSHNIRSLSHACCYAASCGLSLDDFELQLLYGMADPIATAFASKGYLVRFYVPLGEMLPGMGYLVRRLLENTSNESFLRHTFVSSAEIDTLLRAPNFEK